MSRKAKKPKKKSEAVGVTAKAVKSHYWTRDTLYEIVLGPDNSATINAEAYMPAITSSLDEIVRRLSGADLNASEDDLFNIVDAFFSGSSWDRGMVDLRLQADQLVLGIWYERRMRTAHLDNPSVFVNRYELLRRRIENRAIQFNRKLSNENARLATEARTATMRQERAEAAAELAAARERVQAERLEQDRLQEVERNLEAQRQANEEAGQLFNNTPENRQAISDLAVTLRQQDTTARNTVRITTDTFRPVGQYYMPTLNSSRVIPERIITDCRPGAVIPPDVKVVYPSRAHPDAVVLSRDDNAVRWPQLTSQGSFITRDSESPYRQLRGITTTQKEFTITAYQCPHCKKSFYVRTDRVSTTFSRLEDYFHPHYDRDANIVFLRHNYISEDLEELIAKIHDNANTLGWFDLEVSRIAEEPVTPVRTENQGRHQGERTTWRDVEATTREVLLSRPPELADHSMDAFRYLTGAPGEELPDMRVRYAHSIISTRAGGALPIDASVQLKKVEVHKVTEATKPNVKKPLSHRLIDINDLD